MLLLLRGGPPVPPTPPPAGSNVERLRRVSPVLPAASLDAFGHPDGWAATSTTQEEWGRFQVLFGGVDVTFLRDVACVVESYSTAEPFGDETAVIRFPQISPFETLGSGDLAPFVDWATVSLRRVYWDFDFNEERIDPDWGWDGFWVSEDTGHSETDGGTTFSCVGVLYEADLRVAVPSVDPVGLLDIGGRIFEVLNDDAFHFSAPVIPQDYLGPGIVGIGVTSPHLGAYQPVLTGLVQDYLVLAYDPLTGVQWTVDNDERQAVIRLKDMTTEHWRMSVGTKGLTLDVSRDNTMAPKAIWGSGMAGSDACTWRNTFYGDPADLFGALIRPLAVRTEVEPFLHDPVTGEVTGTNPSFDPDVVRVERYENFGRSEKLEATGSASLELQREGDPGWVGQATLHIDAEEGSRWKTRAGQNLFLVGLRGGFQLFHIVHTHANVPAGTVELTIDTRARDLPTVAAIMERRRDNTDLVRRNRPTRNTSRMVDDRLAPFDCESGAGLVGPVAVPAGNFAVTRVPAATRGRIVKIELTASAATELSIGIFDRAVTVAELAGMGSPADDDYWGFDNWPEGSGLVQAVGEGDDLGGYGAGSAADDDAVLDGTLFSDAGFPYESQAPPWLWVVLWAVDAVTISGRLIPGPQGMA